MPKADDIPDAEELKALVELPLSQLSLEDVDRMFAGFAEVSRADGIKQGLGGFAQVAADDFLKEAIRLPVDGTPPSQVSTILESRMSCLQQQNAKHRKVIAGIAAIQSGEPPDSVRRKLESILS